MIRLLEKCGATVLALFIDNRVALSLASSAGKATSLIFGALEVNGRRSLLSKFLRYLELEASTSRIFGLHFGEFVVDFCKLGRDIQQIDFDSRHAHSYDVARHEQAQRYQSRMEALTPKKLCKKQALIEGRVPVSEFERYRKLGKNGDDVHFYLNFCFDQDGQAVVKGEARNNISLVCQRCLRDVPRKLVTPIELAIVSSEKRANELEDLDAIVTEGDTISIVDLIEDDLILGIPEQVCTDPDTCEYTPQFQFQEEAVEDNRPNPFEILENLRSQKKFKN